MVLAEALIKASRKPRRLMRLIGKQREVPALLLKGSTPEKVRVRAKLESGDPGNQYQEYVVPGHAVTIRVGHSTVRFKDGRSVDTSHFVPLADFRPKATAV